MEEWFFFGTPKLHICCTHFICLHYVSFCTLSPCLTYLLLTCIYNLANSRICTLQPWRWKQHYPPKYWYPPTKLHGVTTQKTTIWIITSVIKSCSVNMKVYINNYYCLRTYWTHCVLGAFWSQYYFSLTCLGSSRLIGAFSLFYNVTCML
jgi:hypothetical protein